MIDVSNDFKSALSRPDRHNPEKNLIVEFPELNVTLTKEQIIADSMNLMESIMSGSDLEIIGCISSQFELDIINFSKKLSGKKINVYLQIEEAADKLPLFFGYVESEERQSDKRIKHITAYDALYKFSDTGDSGEIDWEWYNNLQFPMKVSIFRTMLFAKIGITQVSTELPCDDYYFRGLNDNVYNPKTLYEEEDLCIQYGVLYQRKNTMTKKEPEFVTDNWTKIEEYTTIKAYTKYNIVTKDKIVYQCKEDTPNPAGEFDKNKWDELDFSYYYVDDDTDYTDIIRQLCQCNARFGIMNRYEQFEYRKISIPKTSNAFYPGAFPAVFPVAEKDYKISGTDAQFESLYKSCDYEGFSIKNITRVCVRDSKNDKEKGDYQKEKLSKYNRYIVQGNIFIRDLTKTQKKALSKNIYNAIKDITYSPFSCEVFGTPYLECGDSISLIVYDYDKSEKKNEDVWKSVNFIILSRNLTGIQNLCDEYSAKGNRNQRNHITGSELNNIINSTVNQINKIGEYKFVSVSELPADAGEPENSKTFYFIQGEATVK